MEDSKICRGCKEDKLLSCFGKNARYKDGLQPKCDLCVKNKIRLYEYSNKKDCYIYTHSKLNGEVFYVGIGSGDNNFKRSRAKHGRNKEWYNITNNIDYKIDIIHKNLDRFQVEELEKELILFYKRIEDGGSLCNITDGGSGNYGLKHSDETKAIMSESRKSQRLGELSPLWGKTITEEHKKIISESSKGRKWTDEQREKYILSRKGVPRTEEQNRLHSLRLKKFYSENESVLKGRKLSEETKLKLSIAHMGKEGLSGELNPMYGKKGELHPRWGDHHTDEAKRKIGDKNKKQVINIDTLEIFPSTFEVSQIYGLSVRMLKEYLRGRSTHQFPFMYLKDYHTGKTIFVRENRKIICPLINTETLEIYPSITKAEEMTGYSSVKYHLKTNKGFLPLMKLSEYRNLHPNFKHD